MAFSPIPPHRHHTEPGRLERGFWPVRSPCAPVRCVRPVRFKSSWGHPCRKRARRSGVTRRLYRAEGDYRPPFPVAPLIPVLEEAIARGATVEIEYHAFDRPVTVRRVDPLRLEQRGRRGKDYLIAFCHLRGEERTFRVDRMARVEPKSLVEASRAASSARC